MMGGPMGPPMGPPMGGKYHFTCVVLFRCCQTAEEHTQCPMRERGGLIRDGV